MQSALLALPSPPICLSLSLLVIGASTRCVGNDSVIPQPDPMMILRPPIVEPWYTIRNRHIPPETESKTTQMI